MPADPSTVRIASPTPAIDAVLEELDFQLVLDPMQARFQAACRLCGEEPACAYAAFPWPAGGHPVDNLDQVLASGLAVFHRPRCGRKGSRPYRSPVLIGPTWLHAGLCANASVRASRSRHAFFEGVVLRGWVGDVQVFDLVFGS